MPTGGLSEYGSGLQLQTASPGVTNPGNAHINGVMISGQFTTIPTGIGGSNGNEKFGHNITDNGGINSVFFGNSLANGTLGQHVAMGLNCSAFAQASQAIGQGCQAGFLGSTAGNLTALGFSAVAGATKQTNGQVALGSNVSVDSGTKSLAIGSQVTIVGPNTADGTNLGIGSTISTTDLTSTELLLIGNGHNMPNSFVDNALIIGYWGGSSSGVFPVASIGSNQIRIGNASQKTVFIGPYTMVNGECANMRQVADLATTALPADYIINYTSITAPRIVTLPAANSVSPGYKLLVMDSSGNASGVNTITLTRTSTDTINGATTTAVNVAYGCKEITSDGNSKWTVIRSI